MIDETAVGRPLRLFFEKRLATVQADPGHYLNGFRPAQRMCLWMPLG